jgi:hypothetical protein
MTELRLLDELVPEVQVHGDWEDVLRRARRRRAPVLVAALAVAAVATGSALGIALTRDAGATLPPEADRSNVVVVVQPLTGRVVVKAAPWKGHDGICYVFFSHSGCVPRTARATVVPAPPVVGYTFDRRVAAGSAVTLDGRRVPLVLRRFGGRIGTTFFFTRGRLPLLISSVVLRDRYERVIVRRTVHPR